ncbi:MAG: nickel pincer cofactor biosynthesis protein LarC [Armatimonadetes bacterium]|nr:nickel pincer cofactor biosynthesis protein LarC [Armatimonadota bacterium]
MRIAYFDCFAGISGDMTIGALVAAGVDPEALESELSKLGLDGYELRFGQKVSHGITAVDFDVHIHEHDHHGQHHHHRSFTEIARMIGESGLSERVKAQSVAVFRRLGEAEAKVHNTSLDEIHFHEVGAVDSIVDIVGAVIGLEMLGVEEVHVSRLPAGHGFIRAAHGVLPVPAPATVELTRGIPVYPVDAEGEMVTPTGAAIVSALGKSFGKMPEMRVSSVGYGAGKKEFTFPNLLRVYIGDAEDKPRAHPITCLETNIDDMNPQFYDYLMERLFEKGALDVFMTPVQMKKNRPAAMLTVLSPPEREADLLPILFSETTTLGIRVSRVERYCLDREWKDVSTPYGPVRVKIASLDGIPQTVEPEYEDCKRLASEKQVPLKEVYRAAVERWHQGREGKGSR